MIRKLEILIAFFLLFVCGAPSCENEEAHQRREEAHLLEEITQIYSDIESVDLSASGLLIYQSHAQEKLRDIADYFQILSDTSLALSIREKAGELLLQNFISEEVKLSFHQMKKKEISLGLLIDDMLNGHPSVYSYPFNSISIKQRLVEWEKDTFKGQIGYEQMSQDPHIGLSSIPQSIDFYLIKEIKIIGADTLGIWNIRFGDTKRL